MKRTITLLLILALLLTLCGCGGKTEAGADLDNDRGLSAGSIAQLCEIGDTLYYTMWNGTTYLLYGLSDGTFEYVFSWFTPIGYSDIIADGFIAAVSWPVDEKVYAVAVDFQGNTVLDTSFSVAGFPDQALRGVCQGADEDYVYLCTLSSGGYGVPLNGGEPILLYTPDQ